MTLRRALIPLLCPWVLHAQTILPPQFIRVTTCARADSLLGPIPDGLHPGLMGSEFAPGLLHASTGGRPNERRAGENSVSFTLDVLRKPHPATMDQAELTTLSFRAIGKGKSKNVKREA